MNTREIREFRSALRQFERINDLQLKSCCSGVTLPQCLVLLEAENSRPLTVGELASRLRLDDSTLSRTIEGLVRKELLERRPDERDRRAVRVHLTPAGSAVCRTIHRDNDAYYRRVLRRIPASRRQAVMRSFVTLVKAFLDHETAEERSRS